MQAGLSELKGKLLIVDDDKILCAMLQKRFAGEYDVAAFSNPEEAIEYLRQGARVDVVLTDLIMPKLDGMEVLNIVKSESFNTDVVIMTAFGRIDGAVEAMRKGAYDYVTKPFTIDELALRLKNIFEKRRVFEDNINLRKLMDSGYRPENIIGESEEMKEVYRFIELVSRTDATVFISGESGTGKELVARAIHALGDRKERRFVSVNCSAIPETLFESGLFGYTKGAFSGATSDTQGLFEYANGGTLFLDEIADTPLATQAKLLRALQERSFRPVGGRKEISVNVRVICATNRDLREMIQENRFRADLFYRINVVSVHLPPLRERRNDIPLLFARFVNKRKKIDPRVFDLLSHYTWPGNVRELKNLAEKLVTLSDADTITPHDLPPEILRQQHGDDDETLPYAEMKKKAMEEFDRAIIRKALLKNNGNVTKAAGDLRLDRANFQRLMRRYHISSGEFKERAAVPDSSKKEAD